MSVVGMLMMAVGVAGAAGAAYGYKKATDEKDDKKKKTYMYLGGFMVFVILAGVALLFMGGGSGGQAAMARSPSNLLPNDPKDLASLENRHTDIIKSIQSKQNRLAQPLEEKLKYLRRN